tara:strand:- start:125 stop:328 length:204 start_codon:yes stop_codon:yes gene_type:complete
MMVMPVALMGIVRIVVIRMVVMGKVLEPLDKDKKKVNLKDEEKKMVTEVVAVVWRKYVRLMEREEQV